MNYIDKTKILHMLIDISLFMRTFSEFIKIVFSFFNSPYTASNSIRNHVLSAAQVDQHSKFPLDV